MSDQRVTDWLLATTIPSIRYFTLRDLLGKKDDDPAVQSARQEMTTAGPIPDILAQQTDTGNWANEHSYYTPKYVSTHWSMMLLAELGIPSDNTGFQKGIEFMLADTEATIQTYLRQDNYGLVCLWGNILRYVAHGGRMDDPRAQTMLACVHQQMETWEWKCPHNDGLPCAWGVGRTLWGLAAVPAEHRSLQLQEIILHGLDFLLDQFQLEMAHYPTPGKVHKVWHRLNFPLFYQTDILFILRVVSELNAMERGGVQAARDWLLSLRQKNGRWRGTSPYKSRTWGNLGGSEETSRWVTLHALHLLKAV